MLQVEILHNKITKMLHNGSKVISRQQNVPSRKNKDIKVENETSRGS